MIGAIRNSRFTKFLSGVMALYLLNISVDTTDGNPADIPQDLSINDQESIIELVLEKVLGYENAIKEYDDREREDHNKKKNTKIDFLVYQLHDQKNRDFLLDSGQHLFSNQHSVLTLGFSEIDTPPPKL